MLSSLTPLAEHGRGHRYRTTVAWFIVGGFIGGCALGATAGLLAVGVRALGPSSSAVLAVAALMAAIAFASDLELFGFRLPIHHRQVNERWLDQFRAWVYGVGFGFQIGMGLATYIMTASLYLLLVVSALSQSVVVAVTLGASFGLVRGLAVLLGRTITNTESLRSFHRRFSAIGPQIRLLTIAVEGGCVVACSVALWVPTLVRVYPRYFHDRLRLFEQPRGPTTKSCCPDETYGAYRSTTAAYSHVLASQVVVSADLRHLFHSASKLTICISTW